MESPDQLNEEYKTAWDKLTKLTEFERVLCLCHVFGVMQYRKNEFFIGALKEAIEQNSYSLTNHKPL
jgi:hypothetical protein